MQVSKQYGAFTVTVEAENQKDMVENLIKAHETCRELLAERVPGKVLNSGKDSDNWRFSKREVEKDKKKFIYYELVANEAPYPRLSLGVLQDGSGYFPKRKDKDGKEIGVRGWQVFKKNED